MEDHRKNPSNAAANKENFTPVSFIDGLAKKHKEHTYDQGTGNFRFKPGSNSMGLSDLSPDLNPNVKSVGLWRKKPVGSLVSN